MNKKDDLHALVSCIPDPVVGAFATYCLSRAPWHFWQKPSSAGKYHPKDEHEFGGLLLHTIRVVRVGLIICDSRDGYLDKNIVLPACMLHDICRYGMGIVHGGSDSEFSVPEHPELAAELIRRLGGDNENHFSELIARAVETHTGRWGRIHPRNETEWAVHYADCIEARSQEFVL